MHHAKCDPANLPPSGSRLNLTAMRLARRISLEEIAAQTKISMRFLKAIEDEDFAQLPGGIFNTNYLRQYAEILGIDPGPLLEKNGNSTEAPAKPKGANQAEPRGFFGRLFRVPA